MKEERGISSRDGDWCKKKGFSISILKFKMHSSNFSILRSFDFCFCISSLFLIPLRFYVKKNSSRILQIIYLNCYFEYCGSVCSSSIFSLIFTCQTITEIRSSKHLRLVFILLVRISPATKNQKRTKT